MKRMLFLMLAAALCGGCRSAYKMTLTDGSVMTVRGKPQYDASRGCFIYRDGNGNKQMISAVTVREVKPNSWKSSENSKTIKFLQ